ncbi:MAG TPA: hypothetical protein PKA28_10965 [Methylomusa anaerophila]|nr:hypothetical protein [Methylomusa anaerophila]HML88956.1 hypothetical protein [Methylomusa anaerophila]
MATRAVAETPSGESREPATRPAGRLTLDIGCSLKMKKAAHREG